MFDTTTQVRKNHVKKISPADRNLLKKLGCLHLIPLNQIYINRIILSVKLRCKTSLYLTDVKVFKNTSSANLIIGNPHTALFNALNP